MRRLIVLLATTLFTCPVWSQSASSGAIDDVRAALNERRFSAALSHLQRAIDSSFSIADAQRKEETLATLYFYLAVVSVEIDDEESARTALGSYFELVQKPEYDRERYGHQFNSLFDLVRKERSEPKDEGLPFAAVYPDYSAAPAATSSHDLGTWDHSPDFSVLGTTSERNEWKTLRDNAARAAFVERFWRERDLTPATPLNELRAEFTRRVGYADRVFGNKTTRGSFSDRGRVFLLLGPPDRIHIEKFSAGARTGPVIHPTWVTTAESTPSPLAEAQLRAMQKNEAVAGADVIERWSYRPSQLPVSVPSAGIKFAFARREGAPDAVMQREFFAWKALHDITQLRRSN